MRYFFTNNANRPYVAGDFTFEFDPVVIRGGSWTGVLAVAEDAAASALASAGLNSVEEITLEQYDNVKKKQTAGPSNFPSFQSRQNVPDRSPVEVVTPAAPRTDLPSGSSIAGMIGASIRLEARALEPPFEPLLVEVKKGRPKL